MKIFKLIYKTFEWLYSLLEVVFYSIKILTTSSKHSKKNHINGKNNDDTNHRLIDDELKNKKYGVLKDDYAKLDKAVRNVFFWTDTIGIKKSVDPSIRESENEAYRQSEPLKAKGDEYEYFIGRQFEKNGDLVIYNGFINGFDDQGIDIIVLSPKTKSVNLVQCKNWINKSFTVDEIEKIYSKLDNYNIGHYLDMECNDINFYLENHRDNKTILTILHDSKKYQIRKTLYLSSDKVVDLAIGKHLTMMKPNIFKFKDMKMVVKDM